MEWQGFPGFAWMSGMFKLPTCDYCDDVFAELADITFMDAWLPEYSNDSAGTSIVISRSAMAEKLLVKSNMAPCLTVMKELSISKVIESQQFVVKNKRVLLSHRLWVAARYDRQAPPKRVSPVRPSLLQYMLIRNAEKIRLCSYAALRKQKESGEPGLAIFDQEMASALNQRKWLYRMVPTNIRNGLLRRLSALKGRLGIRRNK